MRLSWWLGRFDEPVAWLDHGVLVHCGSRNEVDGLTTLPLLVNGETVCYAESYKTDEALRVRGRIPLRWRWRWPFHRCGLSGEWDGTVGVFTLVKVSAAYGQRSIVIGTRP